MRTTEFITKAGARFSWFGARSEVPLRELAVTKYLSSNAVPKRLGVAVIIGVAVFATHWEMSTLTSTFSWSGQSEEERLTGSFNLEQPSVLFAADPRGRLSVEGPLPDLGGAIAWLNSALAQAGNSLRGKVVLVDFWTYTHCINSSSPPALCEELGGEV